MSESEQSLDDEKVGNYPALGELNLMQEKFAREYIKDGNGTAAAKRAGYSDKSAGQQACELLKLPKIQKLIDRLLAQARRRMEIDADKVLGEMADVAFANMADYIRISGNGEPQLDLSDTTRQQQNAIESFEVREVDGEKTSSRSVKFKLHSKLTALDQLAKHLKLYQEQIDVTTNGESIKQDTGEVIDGLMKNNPEYVEFLRQQAINKSRSTPMITDESDDDDDLSDEAEEQRYEVGGE